MSTSTSKPTQQATQMVTLTIDGQTTTVPKGTTVYNACKQLQIDIPIFCYQDRMPPFGACRVCMVEIEKMEKPQPSCTLQATEGMIVKTQSPLAVKGRNDILEFLLINHPLDCPICDRGGECPLQDQTLKFGKGKSRFYEDKRRFFKPLPLGPVLMLDRERCISCARCTRFGDLVAGDHALEFIERGYKTEVGTPDGGPAKSKFIGNTIMICPVGALTSQVYRFRARPWDNDSTNSTCTLCPIGCNMILDARDGEIVRTRSQENPSLNDIWLCDKGWFGYEFTYHPERLQQPLIRRSDVLTPASWDEALSLIANKIREAKPAGKLAAMGGNTLTVEENFLFQKLYREGAGINHVDHRINIFSPSPLDQETTGPGMKMPIGDCEKLSFASLLGVDLTEEYPIIWLRLKQAINRGAKIDFIGHFTTEISNHLASNTIHPPKDSVKIINQYLTNLSALAKGGQPGALFVGKQYLRSPYRSAILTALEKFAAEHPNVTLNILEESENSAGARFAGMHPAFGPNGNLLQKPGMSAREVLQTASKEGWSFLHVAGADPASKFSEKVWQEARQKLGFLVVQDLFLTKTARDADVVLPTLSFVEKHGSFLNIEGRIQKIQPGKEIPAGLYSDAEIFTIIALKLNISPIIEPFFADLLKESHVMISEHQYAHESKRKNEASLKDSLDKKNTLQATFSTLLFDQGVRMRHNKHLSEFAKEPKVRIHPEEAKKQNLTTGNVISIKTNEGNIQAKIFTDSGVAKETIVLPLGFDEIPVKNLGMHLWNGMPVEIEMI